MSLRPGDSTVLQPNMTFHLIPGMWLDDWGIEISECIRITETGAEPFCGFDRRLFVAGVTRRPPDRLLPHRPSCVILRDARRRGSPAREGSMTVRRIAALLLMLVALPALAACGTAQPTAYAPRRPGRRICPNVPIAGGLFEVTFAGKFGHLAGAGGGFRPLPRRRAGRRPGGGPAGGAGQDAASPARDHPRMGSLARPCRLRLRQPERQRRVGRHAVSALWPAFRPLQASPATARSCWCDRCRPACRRTRAR